MKRSLFNILFIALFFFLTSQLYAQSPIIVNNGVMTPPVTFAGNCTYNWKNSNPSIGLPPSGTGNIASFKAINTGTSAVTAIITATPQPNGFAYISNNTDGTVSVIDLATNKVVGNPITVGNGPEYIAISPDGTRVYVEDIGDSNPSDVSVIDATTNTTITRIPIVNEPSFGLAVSPDGSKLYIGCIGSGTNNGSVTMVSTTTFTKLVSLSFTYPVFGITLSPDGSLLYAANSSANNVAIVNTKSFTVVGNIPLAYSANEMVISPNGNTLFVCNILSNKVSIINTTTNSVSTAIPVGASPLGIAISPDGSRVYVANSGSNNVSVIDGLRETFIANIPVGIRPTGVSVTPDGKYLYVVDESSNNVLVINTANYQTVTPITVGVNPDAIGNFIAGDIGCSPTTFTITVNPSSLTPTITYTPPTGTISACKGTPSADPNIQQFNASGTNLTGDITVTAPTGFEVSRDIDGPYSSTLTLTETLGSVGSSLIYVRSGATAPVGTISNENVTLTSPGASQSVPLSGIIYAIPSANTPGSQTKINGQATDPVVFTGNADIYTWVNNNTSIGLAANGTGDIASFTAINNTGSPIIATITVTPVNGADCGGSPDEFYITVDPTPPVLTVTGKLTPLTTVYGTPSPAESFTVSCSAVGSAILVTPPEGFEVSSDGTTFSSTVTITAKGSSSPSPVYIRLASSTPVGNNYGGNIVVTTANTSDQQIAMPVSTVTPAPLTITADNKTKPVGAVNPPLTVTYNGFVNNDGAAQLSTLPVLSTTATISSAVGQYTITVSGAASPEYNINYLQGILTVTPSLSLQDIPNTFTPNSDGRNDTWVINGLQYYPIATVNIFNRWGQKLYYSIGYPVPWDGTYHGKALPTGAYYYIIDLKNGQPLIAGFVEIIR